MSDLRAEGSSFSITISWSAPFSLHPDIWYSVLISNVTDEDHPTAVPCTDCHNLIQTHYTFSPHLPSPCHKYTFTVIPQNGVGQGDSSHPVVGYTGMCGLHYFGATVVVGPLESRNNKPIYGYMLPNQLRLPFISYSVRTRLDRAFTNVLRLVIRMRRRQVPHRQASTPRPPHVMFLTRPSTRLAIFIACYVARAGKAWERG